MKRLLWCLVAAVLCRAAAPVVTKVEPPDWPSVSRATTLRLLLTGSNLAAARVTGCDAAAAKVDASGSYLFVDLPIAAGAKAGPCPLQIATAGGTTVARFAITP